MKRPFLSRFIPALCLSTIILHPQITCGQMSGLVEVLPVEQRAVSNEIELLGTSHPVTRSPVAAQTGGAVLTRNVEEGDQVKKGDIIIQLDPEILTTQVEAARAQVEAAKAEHEEQLQRLERSNALFSKGRISTEAQESDLQREKTLNQRWVQAQANARELELLLDRMAVKAPFNGVVTRAMAEPGQWVSTGQSVAELLDLSAIEVMVDLPEQYRDALQQDGEIHLHASSLPELTFSGTIIALIPDADTASRTLPVKIRVENPDGQLHAGMDLRVRLPVSAPRDALLVHKDAILTQGNGYSVFTVIEGKAVPVPVVRKQSYGDFVEVEADLQPGQDVVVRGNERIRPGQEVQTRPYNQAP